MSACGVCRFPWAFFKTDIPVIMRSSRVLPKRCVEIFRCLGIIPLSLLVGGIHLHTLAHTRPLTRTHISAERDMRRTGSSTEIFPVLLNSIGFSCVDVLHVSSSSSLLIGSLTLSDQLCCSVGVVLTGRVEGKDFRLIKRCLRTLLLPRNSAASLAVV